jgi:hypothetical protein
MKKIVLVAVLLLSVFALSACDGDGDDGSRVKDGAAPQIVELI